MGAFLEGKVTGEHFQKGKVTGGHIWREKVTGDHSRGKDKGKEIFEWMLWGGTNIGGEEEVSIKVIFVKEFCLKDAKILKVRSNLHQ